MSSTSRRQFNRLALAAFSGALAGATLGCSHEAQEKPVESKTTPPSDKQPAAASDKTAAAGSSKLYDENLLLVGDPHVCRGLNQCKNQGKTKMNACAGQGACATAELHSCDGLNSCKGQGGCGDHPGQNKCKGQGACAVALKDKTWEKARAKFVELMKAQHKPVGPAPPAKS